MPQQRSYSRLESIANTSAYQSSQTFAYQISAPTSFASYSISSNISPTPSFSYQDTQRSSYGNSTPFYLHIEAQKEYHFSPEQFLNPLKAGHFVGDAKDIQDYVEDTFERIFHKPFPKNIKISILNEHKFRKIAPHPSTIGLSLNRGVQGLLSEIFVLSGSIGRVMLTLGHELGHVLTPTLSNCHDEEAKAFAFSLEWMNVIKKHNIANLSDAIITENPAHNGLHNVAFAFVQDLLKKGEEVWAIYLALIKGILRVSDSI